MSEETKNENEQLEKKEIVSEEVIIIPDFEESGEESAAPLSQVEKMKRYHIKPEDLEKPEPLVLTAKQKRESFMYYYKKPIIIALCVIAALAYVFFLSIPEKRDYDIHAYCSQQNLESDFCIEPLEDFLERFGNDIDSDGEVIFNLDYYDINANQQYPLTDDEGNPVLDMDGNEQYYPISQANPFNYQLYIASSATLNKDMTKGDVFLLMMDEDNFNTIFGEYGEEAFCAFNGKVFVPLYEDEEFAACCEENRIEARLGLCLINKTEKTEKSEKKLAKWQECYDYMSALMEAKPELFN